MTSHYVAIVGVARIHPAYVGADRAEPPLRITLVAKVVDLPVGEA